MAGLSSIDLRAIARACERFNVERLRVFGSILGDRFDPERSDVDILVDFKPGSDDPFADCFDLKFELEQIFGREVYLFDASAVRNPYFRQSAVETFQELYAA